MKMQKFQFFNIVPYSPGKEKEVAADMAEYQKRTGNDVVLYSLSFDPEGVPAMDKALRMIESYRKLKAELAGTPIRLGVLLQSVLGHRTRAEQQSENWTRSINIDGEPARFCPFDPRFQAYITEYITLLAKEDPVFMLGDDDIRSFSPKVVCFCPLHVAEFNRRAGTDYTSDQLREAVRDSKPGDRIYTIFDQLRRDTVNGVGALIRKAIDTVDPEIPAGTCMPGWEFRFNGETSKAIAGKNPAVMRLGNGNYMERSPKDFPRNVVRTQIMREAHSDIPVVLDEADTCPHNLYSRASISFHAKLCSGIMSGLNGAKIWCVNAHKNGYPVSRNYTDILAENKGFYPALAEAAANSRKSGVIIPGHRNFPKWHPLDWKEFFVERETWADMLFGAYGIPFQCSFDLTRKDQVYAIAGEETVQRFSDDELRSLLSCRVLIDGRAAVALTQRGFSDLTGVKAEDTPFALTREVHVKTGQNYPISYVVFLPHLTLTDPAAEEMTVLVSEPFVGSGETENVGSGTVFFRNRLGGLICTTAFNMKMKGWDIYSEPRKDWLIEILDRLYGKPVPGIVLDQQYIMTLSREEKDGAQILSVFNLCFDPLKRIRIRCAGTPKTVELLGPDGLWHDVPYACSDDVLTVEKPMACYETAILRIRG